MAKQANSPGECRSVVFFFRHIEAILVASVTPQLHIDVFSLDGKMLSTTLGSFFFGSRKPEMKNVTFILTGLICRPLYGVRIQHLEPHFCLLFLGTITSIT